MRKIFVDEIKDGLAEVGGGQHRHLSLVLRAKVGDAVEVSAQDGFVYSGIIKNITSDVTRISVGKPERDLTEPLIETALFFGVLKGDHNDIIVQKATELGATALYPVLTKHAVAQSVKTERLNKIAFEAAQQCGRGRVPKVSGVISFDEMLKLLSGFDKSIYPYERATEPSLRGCLKDSPSPIKRLALIVGPEGGFCDSEAESLTRAGAVAVTLGHRILRAETACIASLSCVMYELGCLGRDEL